MKIIITFFSVCFLFLFSSCQTVENKSQQAIKKENEIFFLEVNTLPGLTDTSLFPRSVEAIQIDYKSLLLKIISLATK